MREFRDSMACTSEPRLMRALRCVALLLAAMALLPAAGAVSFAQPGQAPRRASEEALWAVNTAQERDDYETFARCSLLAQFVRCRQGEDVLRLVYENGRARIQALGKGMREARYVGTVQDYPVTRLDGWTAVAERYQVSYASPFGAVESEVKMIQVTDAMKSRFPWITATPGEWIQEDPEEIFQSMELFFGSLELGPCIPLGADEEAYLSNLEAVVASELESLTREDLIHTGLCGIVPGFTQVVWPYAEICESMPQVPFLDSVPLTDNANRLEVYKNTIAEIAAEYSGQGMTSSRENMFAILSQLVEWGSLGIATAGPALSITIGQAHHHRVLPFRNGVGALIRDHLVEQGIYKGRKATYFRAWERIGRSLEGAGEVVGAGVGVAVTIPLSETATDQLLSVAYLEAATEEAVEMIADHAAVQDPVLTQLLHDLRRENATQVMLEELLEEAVNRHGQAEVTEIADLTAAFAQVLITARTMGEVTGKAANLARVSLVLSLFSGALDLIALRDSVRDISFQAQKASVAITFARQASRWNPTDAGDREAKAIFQAACLLSAYGSMIRLFDATDQLRLLQGFQEWLGDRINDFAGIGDSAWIRWHGYLHIGEGEARPELRDAFDVVQRARVLD